MIRRRSVLRGVVQGVGFRPHVARVADRFAVSGLCGNDDSSVFIEVQGEDGDVAGFLHAVTAELPPLAQVISRDDIELDPVSGEHGFRIVASERATSTLTLVPPDMARCEACLTELTDPGDRRFGYPFISCTDCGPRFSVIRDLPYDRPNTTLAEFPMCPACEQEYADPTNRRYHAEPIGCFDCGPRVWLETSEGEVAQWGDAITAARGILNDGGIVAVKGLGGFTLFCDATSAAAVARLRERKHRPGKPLAVIARDADCARLVVELTAEQLMELTAPQRPIVLAPARSDSPLADGVAPGLDEVGVMLPSAPVHDLLLSDGAIRVATSGNLSGEPLAFDNDIARRDLAGIADALLLNDRDIHVPVEDSVLLADGDGVLPIRRSRGFAPLPVALPGLDGAVLAVGGELKNTFTLTRDQMAFVSSHIGDMGSLGAQRAFERSVDQLLRAHRLAPQLIVADRHPGYATTAWATRHAESGDIDLLTIQHHHAHALSLVAEHGRLDEEVLCVVFDGTGYGDDGTVWGGELLRVRGLDAERLWHLPTFGLVGGDLAVAEPWRCAVALLDECGIDVEGLPPAKAAMDPERALVRSQLASGEGVVRTSSAGRLFDAVASLLGVRHRISYEAQAAMELERAARGCRHPEHAVPVPQHLPELVASLADGVRDGHPTACLARTFHAALADLVADEVAVRLGERATVGFSGGVFQNRMFTRDLAAALNRTPATVTILQHRLVPANDGGLSLGQAAAGCLHLDTGRAAQCA